jgi:hypothetical protein
MIALDDLKQSRAFPLESIPAFTTALEQVRGGGVKVKLLAAELAGVGPADPFDQEALAAEQHEIDRRAQKFLLDHDLPGEKYLEALAAVEAGRDRAEPVVPLRRPAPAPVKAGGTKLLDSKILAQRAQDYCEQRGWSAGNGELFGKALDAVLAEG